VAGADEAAVGGAVEESFGPVPGGVIAEDEPERAGAANHEAEDETGDGDVEDADEGFAGIGKMGCAEAERKDDGGGPEGSDASETEEKVAAEGEFFVEGDAEENEGPGEGVAKGGGGVERDGVDAESA